MSEVPPQPAYEAGSATTAEEFGYNDEADAGEIELYAYGKTSGFTDQEDGPDGNGIEFGAQAGAEREAKKRQSLRRSLAITAAPETPVPQAAAPQEALPDFIEQEKLVADAGRTLIELVPDAAESPATENKTRTAIEHNFYNQLNDVEPSPVARVGDGNPLAFGDDWVVQNAAPPQQQPQAERSTRRRRFSTRRSMSGLLSLSMALQIPEGSQSVEFEYSGNRTAESGIGINVAWQDRDALDLGRIFLMTAVALFFWLMISLSVAGSSDPCRAWNLGATWTHFRRPRRTSRAPGRYLPRLGRGRRVVDCSSCLQLFFVGTIAREIRKRR